VSRPGTSGAARVVLAVYLLCFGYGALTHGYDFWRWGWWPYAFGPPFANLFWNMLLFLDAGVVALLLAGWRRAGLILALLVMIADVFINAYVVLGLGMGDFSVELLVQTALLGFILGSIAFLWPRSHIEGVEDRARPA
jgi:hypothetical protein